MRLSIIILNWNGRSMIEQFLPSVVKYSPEAEIVVADNASTDESSKFLSDNYPTVRQIILDCNYGFAEGYNRAIAQVNSEYILLLNNDVEVTDGWLDPLLTYMDANINVAACQPKLLCHWEKDSFEYAGACGGYIDLLGYPYCRGRIFDTVEQDFGQYDTTTKVTWATGAALLIRNSVFREVGGLDKRFFAHQEEIDLCWRLRARGYDIVCIPDSVVFHFGGGTLKKDNPQKTYLNFRNNLFLLYKNLPMHRLWWVMSIRTVLDAMAAMVFLLKGKRGDAAAIWKAHKDFQIKKKGFKEDRLQNLQKQKVSTQKILSRHCILFQYYALSRKTFNQLPKFQ